MGVTYLGRLDAARWLSSWSPTRLAESISVLDYVDAEDVDGTTDNAAGFAAAFAAGIAAGKQVVAPALSAPYVWGSAINITLAAGQTLDFKGTGGTQIKVTATALTVTATTIATPTAASSWSRGDRTLGMVSAAGIQRNDVVRIHCPLIQETGWYYPAYDCHEVEGVSANDVRLKAVKGLEFSYTPKAEQTWIASGGEETFWYPSYYTSAEDIEVLVNDEVVTEGVSFVARSGGSNTRGWDVTLTATAEDVVVIRRVAAISHAIYRGGKFICSDIHFQSEVDASCVILQGLRRPAFISVGFSSTQRLGAVFSIRHCISPYIRNSVLDGGLYLWFFLSGTRGGRVYGITASNAHHAVATGTFPADLEVDTATGSNCAGVLDVHPAMNVIHRNVTDYAEAAGGLNNRGSGGALINARLSNGVGFNHGIAWLNNGASDSPAASALTDARKFVMYNVVADGYAFKVADNIDWAIISSVFRHINNGLGGGEIAPLSIGVFGSIIDTATFRFTGSIEVNGTTMQSIDFHSSNASYPPSLITGSVFAGHGPFIKNLASDNVRRRNLEVVTTSFTYVQRDGDAEADDGKLGTAWYNPSKLDVTFDDSTFDGVTFADAASSRSESIVYGGTTPNTYLNGAVDQDE